MAATTDKALQYVEPLDGSNFHHWKFKMTLILKKESVWTFANGTAKMSTDEAGRADYEAKDDKALALICLAVKDSQLVHVRNATTANEAWTALGRQFERKDLANKVFLKRKLFNLRMRESDSLASHLSQLQTLADRLDAIGSPIEENDFVATLLASLPESYDTLITALSSRDEDELTKEFVVGRLTHEEERRKAQVDEGGSKSPESTALAAKDKGGRYRGTREREAKAAVPNEERKEHQSTRKYPERRKKACYRCHKEGHLIRNCPEREGGGISNARAAITEEGTGTLVDSVLLVRNKGRKRSGWIIDSGCTKHMTYAKASITDYHEFATPVPIVLGDNRKISAKGKGNVIVTLHNGKKAQLQNVYHVPGLGANLFSIRATVKTGIKVVVSGNGVVMTRNGEEVARGLCSGDDLYWLCCEKLAGYSAAAQIDDASEKDEEEQPVNRGTSVSLWHARFGHANVRALRVLEKKGMVKGMKSIGSRKVAKVCPGCVMGKQCRKSCKRKGTRAKRILGLVHTDICGPMETQSPSKKRYFISFIDDYTRFAKVYLMHEKSEALQFLKEYVAVAELVTGEKVQVLRSDNGAEYTSNAFREFCATRGITQQLVEPYQPEHNGVAERFNRTVVEAARAMLHGAQMSKTFWAEVVNTAVYLHNLYPTRAVKDKTPSEAWHRRKPDVRHLRVFGTTAYVHIPDAKRKKWDAKSVKCRLVGYAQPGYRLVVDGTNQILVSSNVEFDEESASLPGNNPATSTFLVAEEAEEMCSRDTPDEEFSLSDPANVFHATLASDIPVPKNIKQAFQGQNAEQWKAAAASEYSSLQETGTWELADLPPSRKTVSSKWIFTVKSNPDGSIDRSKARLVARGFSQEPGVDYDETFAPVVRYSSLRMILALAAEHNMEVHQMDVKTAFLNGDLDEEIYMAQPEGFVVKGSETKVCRLRKSLYGLKQAARCWNQKLDKYLKSKGYVQSGADCCVYYKFSDDKMVIMAVYVDDLVIASNSKRMLELTKMVLAKGFKMTDLGELRYCLGIEVVRDREHGKIFLHQQKYLAKLLEEFGMQDAKAAKTPMEVGLDLPNMGESNTNISASMYQKAIGMLLYVALTTRPDIAAAVRVVSQYAKNPAEVHWTAVKRILRYVKGTPTQGIGFSKSQSREKVGVLEGYVDADWAGDKATRRSCTGFVFMLGNGPVSWISKRQSGIALSTAEAEYVGLCMASQEAVWLRQLLATIAHRVSAEGSNSDPRR